MANLSTTELLNYYTAFEAVDDKFFMDKILVLEELYSFYFNSDIEGLFWPSVSKESDEAKLIKLDGNYYLVGVVPRDEFRNSRSALYHIRCEQINELLFKNDFINKIPCPTKVYAQKDRNYNNKGLIFNIVDYKESIPLLTLITTNYDDYYPSCKIEFNSKLIHEATPLLEKTRLEKEVQNQNPSNKKIKI